MSSDLHRIAEFVWLEADILDQKDYSAWLDLWDEAGHYVIPIEREGRDHASRLNYAYDDDAMRRMRIRRLTSGQSVSARSAGITVRSVSRFRLLAPTTDGSIKVRCAQNLTEFRNGKSRVYVGDVTYTLRPFGETFRISEKVVLLVNSADALAGMTFLL